MVDVCYSSRSSSPKLFDAGADVLLMMLFGVVDHFSVGSSFS